MSHEIFTPWVKSVIAAAKEAIIVALIFCCSLDYNLELKHAFYRDQARSNEDFTLGNSTIRSSSNLGLGLSTALDFQ